ncbi:MAG: DUF5684 domain-containing protein [Eubacteriaceae bacterium]|jgi:hypothetical protein
MDIEYIGGVVAIAGGVLYIMQNLRLAKAFGKGTGFGIGLIFLNPIFMMILGFGSAEYLGNPEEAQTKTA